MFSKALLLFFTLFIVSDFAYAEQVKSEDYLCIVDMGSHTQQEFKSILNKIRVNHPKYTKGEIANFITLAYSNIKEKKPNISIYDVAKGTMVISDDNLGIDLENFIIAYLRSQTR